LASQIGHCAHSLVDARCPAHKIDIHGTQDEPSVGGQLAMEPEEVPAVERQDGTNVANGEQEDLPIRPGQSGLTRIANGEYVMAQAAQLVNRRLREVLVREEAGHGSGGLVFLYLPLDEIAMASDEGPGVREILGP
jgi:hypothetical protein